MTKYEARAPKGLLGTIQAATGEVPVGIWKAQKGFFVVTASRCALVTRARTLGAWDSLAFVHGLDSVGVLQPIVKKSATVGVVGFIPIYIPSKEWGIRIQGNDVLIGRRKKTAEILAVVKAQMAMTSASPFGFGASGAMRGTLPGASSPLPQPPAAGLRGAYPMPGSSGPSIYCHACGDALIQGSKYCRKCGTVIPP